MSLFRDCDGPSCDHESKDARDLKLHVIVQHGDADRSKGERRDFHTYECLEEWLAQRMQRRATRKAQAAPAAAPLVSVPTPPADVADDRPIPVFAPRGYST